MTATVLLLACGALSHELVELKQHNRWDHVTIQCLPAELHNSPDQIPDAVHDALQKHAHQYDQVFVAYADCGTGGLLDPVLEAFGVQRLPGAHCYEFFSGQERFASLMNAELGTYFLTDFLVRHFDRLVTQALGLDRFPELRDDYFKHYRKLVYLAQSDSPELDAMSREQAEFLGLAYERVSTGLGPLDILIKEQNSQWLN